MAEANLLGLVAAVALPLAYAQAVRMGCRLAPALLGAVLAYVVIAGFLAALPVMGVTSRLALAASVILTASVLGGRIADPPVSRPWNASSPSRALLFRSVIPTIYVLVVAVVHTVAGPSPAGLVSTFPSLSLVVLAVTHLEVGASEASRIARFLPLGNLSTLAFLAAFCWVSPVVGLGSALLFGYAAVGVMLLVIHMGNCKIPSSHGVAWPGARRISRPRPSGAPWGFATTSALAPTRIYAHHRLAQGRATRSRPHLAHRGGFSPWVETLAW
jgi:hypothetical protein